MMTTSLTDARFTSLHFTPGHLASLDFDEPPETGWSVMPGYEESIEIPMNLEPPRIDADETLPSQLHPSYPFGRPPTLGRPWRGMVGVGNLLGTVPGGGGGGQGIGLGAGDPSSMGGGFGGWMGGGGRWGRGERWNELGIWGEVVEIETKKEVPPGMAGAKRPPSPPSPSLRPDDNPQPRSVHLQNLLNRQRQSTPGLPTDPFDAPVPNETYREDEGEGEVDAQQGGGGERDGDGEENEGDERMLQDNEQGGEE